MSDCNDLQVDILRFVDKWVKSYRTPVPQKEIVHGLSSFKDITVRASVRTLVKKGYLRKSAAFGVGAHYIQVRTIG